MSLVVTRYEKRQPWTVTLPCGRREIVKANQIVVWISLGGVDSKRPTSKPFPAIFDTGTSAALVMNQRDFDAWKNPDDCFHKYDGKFLANGLSCRRVGARIWLHRQSLPKAPKGYEESNPWRLSTPGGIVLRPAPSRRTESLGRLLGMHNELKAVHRAPLPLLGLAAVTGDSTSKTNGLRFALSGYLHRLEIDASRSDRLLTTDSSASE